VLSFWTHVKRLNCIVGTRTCRSGCIMNQLSYGIGCALATRRNICVVRTWLRHLIAISHSFLIGPLLLSRTSSSSRLFFACHVGIVRLSLSSSHNCVCCACCVDLSCTPTIEPQYACCACYRGLLCYRSPDDRTRVDARYARACTRVDCGVSF
jgi:hypothetical protein